MWKIQQKEIIENPEPHYQKIWTLRMSSGQIRVSIIIKSNINDNSFSQSTINFNKTGAIDVVAALCQRCRWVFFCTTETDIYNYFYICKYL